jgi:GMP synthase PP-ATPase subunit
MENPENQEVDDMDSKVKELNKQLMQRKEELIQELNEVNDCEVCMDPDKKMSEFIGDIFYKSMKNLFDVSTKLATKLAHEFLPENGKK